MGADVGMSIAWLASVREDVGLVTHEFLPEFLLVTLLLLIFWGIRKWFRRDARSIY
jgi:hypothetical protein